MDMRTCYCPAALCPRLTTSDGWGDVVGSRSANIIQLLSRSISDSEFYPNSHIHIPILLVVKKKRRGEWGKCLNLYPRVARFFSQRFFLCARSYCASCDWPTWHPRRKTKKDHFDPFDPSAVCIIVRHIASLLRTRQAGLVFECASF